MIIKLGKVIDCSSEHPSYPASNLLQYRSNSSWRCAKPGEMLATVTFQFAEPSCITGVDIGNYRSCVVVLTASTSSEPDKWIPMVNHQFMTHDEAVNGKFRDQVQLFTKKELNPETIKIKFDRAKVTCMQSANLKELFGLSFITFRTEVVVDLGLDVFGKFKMKKTEEEDGKSTVDEFRAKYLKLMGNKKASYKDDLLSKIKESGMNNFDKRQSESKEPMKRPLLEKLEAGKTDEVFGMKNSTRENAAETNGSKTKDKLVEKKDNAKDTLDATVRTPFGDIVPSTSSKTNSTDAKNALNSLTPKADNERPKTNSKKRSLSPEKELSRENTKKKKQDCPECRKQSDDEVCKICNRLPEPKPTPETSVKKKPRNDESRKAKKPFDKLMDDVSFSLSGYVNPQRDEIRRKALKMGARYVADPNTRDNKCTHLICAFKNTPKSQLLKGHCKIVSHAFVEDCFNEKNRFPWRRYALEKHDRKQPESEDEIEGSTSPARSPNLYDVDTDSDSYY